MVVVHFAGIADVSSAMRAKRDLCKSSSKNLARSADVDVRAPSHGGLHRYHSAREIEIAFSPVIAYLLANNFEPGTSCPSRTVHRVTQVTYVRARRCFSLKVHLGLGFPII